LPFCSGHLRLFLAGYFAFTEERSFFTFFFTLIAKHFLLVVFQCALFFFSLPPLFVSCAKEVTRTSFYCLRARRRRHRVVLRPPCLLPLVESGSLFAPQTLPFRFFLGLSFKMRLPGFPFKFICILIARIVSRRRSILRFRFVLSRPPSCPSPLIGSGLPHTSNLVMRQSSVKRGFGCSVSPLQTWSGRQTCIC